MENKKNNIFLLLTNIAVGLLIISPILYALSVTFMTTDQIHTMPPKFLPKSFFLGNYKEVIAAIPIFRFIFNSFLVSTAVTIGQIITSCLSAYAFAFYEFKGKKILFIIIIATVMVPGEAIIISNYLTISSLNLLDTYTGLILPYLTSAMGIFMMRQYFLTVPIELKEASIIDGCTGLQFLTKILMPISKPIIGSLGIYMFLLTWNQYMWPLLITSKPEMRTVQIGMTMLQSSEVQSFGMMLAGIIIIIIPSIFIFIIGQKQLIDGMTSGSVKG
ncbi:carbohydrate ABC transporter permease [Clostridium estertheticum]|uniref:carbohydrate ABC transporter permease n=1 Tax=Clostridium estertheticum TaxID=238834 RepID=UPI001CF1A3C1|nr:carbohydrate ABC transporter permease [Clostridium estertheticum]MCB2356046.1 carbohydrate ABC transporter permease [Clostridium estertheticum]WAG42175.1 carbohydrate ABC transporter permease [Clostridium estertheticum]